MMASHCTFASAFPATSCHFRPARRGFFSRLLVAATGALTFSATGYGTAAKEALNDVQFRYETEDGSSGEVWWAVDKGMFRITGNRAGTMFGNTAVSVIVQARERKVITAFHAGDGDETVDRIDQCLWYPFPGAETTEPVRGQLASVVEDAKRAVAGEARRARRILRSSHSPDAETRSGDKTEMDEEDDLLSRFDNTGSMPPRAGGDSINGFDTTGVGDGVENSVIPTADAPSSAGASKRDIVYKTKGFQSTWPEDANFDPPFLPRLDPTMWSCDRYSEVLHKQILARVGLTRLHERSLALVDLIVSFQTLFESAEHPVAERGVAGTSASARQGSVHDDEGRLASPLSPLPRPSARNGYLVVLAALALPGDLAVFLIDPTPPDFSAYKQMHFKYRTTVTDTKPAGGGTTFFGSAFDATAGKQVGGGNHAASSSTAAYARGELWVDFASKQLKVAVPYSPVKLLTLLVDGKKHRVYTNVALLADDKDPLSRTSAGQTVNTCAVTEDERDDAVAEITALDKLGDTAATNYGAAWIFAGAREVNSHECVAFEAALPRGRTVQVLVADGILHAIEVRVRDGGKRFFSLVEEFEFSPGSGPADASSSTVTDAGVAPAGGREIFSPAATFEPLEQWGCRNFVREQKVFTEQGMSLPAEHEYELTKVALSAHRKSLAFLDARAALEDFESSSDGAGDVSLSLQQKCIFALPGEVEILSATPAPPDFNEIQHLEFDYESRTSAHHRHDANAGESSSSASLFSPQTVGFVVSSGHFAMDVPGGKMLLTGKMRYPAGGSSAAEPPMIDASVVVDTRQQTVVSNVAWTSPSHAAQCVIDDLPVPGDADVARLKRQIGNREKFVRAVVLEDGVTECNLFSLQLSHGQSVHMLASREGELKRLMLFRGRHPDRAFSTVTFRNWRRGEANGRAELERQFAVKQGWHCRRASSVGSKMNSILALEDKGEDPSTVFPTPTTEIPVHARSAALKDSLFAFSGALGQYHMLAIPTLALPGELDLLVNRPAAISRAELKFFHLEYRNAEFRGRFAVNFARRLLYFSGHAVGSGDTIGGSGDSTRGTSFRLTVDARYNSAERGLYVEFRSSKEENFCFKYPVLERAGVAVENGTDEAGRYLHFLRTETILSAEDRRHVECYVWSINLPGRWGEVRGTAANIGTGKTGAEEQNINSLRVYVSVEDGAVVRVEESGAPNSGVNVIEFDAHPGDFAFRTPAGRCEPAKEDRFSALESPLQRVGQADGGALVVLARAIDAMENYRTGGADAPASPPLYLIGVPLEWPGLVEHYRDSAFSFGFTSVMSQQYSAHLHHRAADPGEKKASRAHGELIVDYNAGILLLEGTADELQSGTHLRAQSKLLIVGHTAWTELVTRNGRKCVQFGLEWSQGVKQGVGGKHQALPAVARVPNGFGLSHMREEKNTNPALRRFRVRGVIAFADRNLERLTHLEIPDRGVNVDVRNWKTVRRTDVRAALAKFDRSNCEQSSVVLHRAHWTLADIFLP
eukprot:g8976.t1